MKWRCIHHEMEDVDEAVAEAGVEVAEEEDVEEMMVDEMEVAEEKVVVVAEEKAVVVVGVEAGVVAEGVEEEVIKALLRNLNFMSQNSLLHSFNRLRILILLSCTADGPEYYFQLELTDESIMPEMARDGAKASKFIHLGYSVVRVLHCTVAFVCHVR